MSSSQKPHSDGQLFDGLPAVSTGGCLHFHLPLTLLPPFYTIHPFSSFLLLHTLRRFSTFPFGTLPSLHTPTTSLLRKIQPTFDMDDQVIEAVWRNSFPHGHQLSAPMPGLRGVLKALQLSIPRRARVKRFTSAWTSNDGQPVPVRIICTLDGLVDPQFTFGILWPDGRKSIHALHPNYHFTTTDRVSWISMSHPMSDSISFTSFHSLQPAELGAATAAASPPVSPPRVRDADEVESFVPTAQEPLHSASRPGTPHDGSTPFSSAPGQNDKHEVDGLLPLQTTSDRTERAKLLSALTRGKILKKMVLLQENHPVGGYHPDYLRRLGHCQAPGLHTYIDVVVGDCVPEHLVFAFRSLNGSKTVRVADILVPLLDGEATTTSFDTRTQVDLLSSWLPCSEQPSFHLKAGTQFCIYPDIDDVPAQLGKAECDTADAEYLSATYDGITRIDVEVPASAVVLYEDRAFWEKQLRDHQSIIKQLLSPFFSSLRDDSRTADSKLHFAVLVPTPDTWDTDYSLSFHDEEDVATFFTVVKNGNELKNFDYKSCLVDGIDRPDHPAPRVLTFMSHDQYCVTQVFGAKDVSYRQSILQVACAETPLKAHVIPIKGSEWLASHDDMDIYGIAADNQATQFLIRIPFDRNIQQLLPDLDEPVKMVFKLTHHFHVLPELVGDDALRQKIAHGLTDRLVAARQRAATKVKELRTQHENRIRKNRVSNIFDDGGHRDVEDDSDDVSVFDNEEYLYKIFSEDAVSILKPFVSSLVSDADRATHKGLADEDIIAYRVLDKAKECFRDTEEAEIAYEARIQSMFDVGDLSPSTPEAGNFGAEWSAFRVTQPRHTKPMPDFFFLAQRPKQRDWPAPFLAPFVKIDIAEMVEISGWGEFYHKLADVPPIRSYIWRSLDENTAKAEANAVRYMNNLKESSHRFVWFQWLPFMHSSFPTASCLDLHTAFPGLSAAISSGTFSTMEIKHLQALQRCKGGVAFLCGVPGAGKTTFVMKLAHAISNGICLLDGPPSRGYGNRGTTRFTLANVYRVQNIDEDQDEDRDISPFINEPQTRFVFAGAQNVQLDDALAKWVETYNDKVVRVYSYDVEMRHVFGAPVPMPELKENKSDTGFQKSCRELFNMAHAARLNDRNPSLSPFSLSSRIKQLAVSNPDRWSLILEGIRAREAEPHTFRANETKYMAQARDCAAEVLDGVVAIFCTPVVAREIANHHPSWYPGLVIGDEAGRMTEALSLVLTSAWPKAAVIFAGDPYQFGPVSNTYRGNIDVVAGPKSERFIYKDVFGPQRTYSLLARADAKGMSDIVLSDSYRSEGDCQVFAARKFYHGRMDIVHRNREIHSDVVKSRLSTLLGHTPNVCSIFIDMPDAQEQKVGLTYSNESSARLSIALALWVAQQNFGLCTDLRDEKPEQEVRKATICVMTPYKAQKQHLEYAWQKVSPVEVHRESIDIRLVDEAAGHEADFVIYDMVRTTSTGFTDDRLRNNVAVTRARVCNFFVGSASLISGLSDSNPLKALYSFHESMQAVTDARGYSKYCNFCYCHGHQPAQCPYKSDIPVVCNVCDVVGRRRRHCGRDCPESSRKVMKPLTGLASDIVRPVDNLQRHPLHPVAGIDGPRKKQNAPIPRIQRQSQQASKVTFISWKQSRVVAGEIPDHDSNDATNADGDVKDDANDGWNDTKDECEMGEVTAGLSEWESNVAVWGAEQDNSVGW